MAQLEAILSAEISVGAPKKENIMRIKLNRLAVSEELQKRMYLKKNNPELCVSYIRVTHDVREKMRRKAYGGYTQLKDRGNEAYTRIYDPLRSEHERKYHELERYGFEFNHDAEHDIYYYPSSSGTGGPRIRKSRSPKTEDLYCYSSLPSEPTDGSLRRKIPPGSTPSRSRNSMGYTALGGIASSSVDTDSEWEEETEKEEKEEYSELSYKRDEKGDTNYSMEERGKAKEPADGKEALDEVHLMQLGMYERAKEAYQRGREEKYEKKKIKKKKEINEYETHSKVVFPLAPRYSYRNSSSDFFESASYRGSEGRQHDPAGGTPPPRKSYRGLQFLKPRFDPLEGCGGTSSRHSL